MWRYKFVFSNGNTLSSWLYLIEPILLLICLCRNQNLYYCERFLFILRYLSEHVCSSLLQHARGESLTNRAHGDDHHRGISITLEKFSKYVGIIFACLTLYTLDSYIRAINSNRTQYTPIQEIKLNMDWMKNIDLSADTAANPWNYKLSNC